MSNFSKNLLYPQISTYKSLRLSSAPGQDNVPDQGYVYEWQSTVQGQIYVNFKFHNGTIKQYKLGVTNQIITPDNTPDFQFTQQDIVNNQIVINNNNAISQIGLYNDSNKSTYTIINVPVICNNNQTVIDMSDVEAPYGGVVKFVNGTIIINYQDDIFDITNAYQFQQFDAENGLIQVVHSIADNSLQIIEQNIKNLQSGRMMKIIVNKGSKPVYVQDTQVQLERFLVCYMNVFGKVRRIGRIVEIED